MNKGYCFKFLVLDSKNVPRSATRRSISQNLDAFIVGANLKVPPLVHFTWFYTNKDDLKPEEMKFYQMVSLIAAYKKIKPHKILCQSATWCITSNYQKTGVKAV